MTESNKGRFKVADEAQAVWHVCADRENDGHFRHGDVYMRRVGKKSSGRFLDGVLHDGYPIEKKNG